MMKAIVKLIMLAVAAGALAKPVPTDILHHSFDEDAPDTLPFLQHLSQAEDQVLHIVHPDGTTHSVSFPSGHLTLLRSSDGGAGSVTHHPLFVSPAMLPHPQFNGTVDLGSGNSTAKASANLTTAAAVDPASANVTGSPLSAAKSANQTAGPLPAMTHNDTSADGTTHAPPSPELASLLQNKTLSMLLPPVAAADNGTQAGAQPINKAANTSADDDKPAAAPVNATIIPSPTPTSAEAEHKNGATAFAASPLISIGTLGLAAVGATFVFV